jgi:alkanesulfonate monooxygenase SsuD/methylene tetrahydromethanopterin reductase-like flavin-dependent oxidoreductase (luciferase family)
VPNAPKVFVRLPHSWCGASVDGVLRVAEAAESLGFDGVSVQDHILSSRGTSPCGHAHDGDDRDVLESLSTLAFVAARTSRVKLLTGVLVAPFRHPIWVAKAAGAVDVLSGGRLVLGVGIGWPGGRSTDPLQKMSLHAQLARRESDLFVLPGPRAKLMDEWLTALDLLWREDVASYEGELIRFEGVDLRPRPVQRPRPPIWIGGRADPVLRRVALLADGWFPSQASVEVVAAGRERIAATAAELGRPMPSLAVNIFASLDADGERARDAMRDALAHRFHGDAPLFEATLAGHPDEVQAHMRRYVDAGVRTFDLKFLPLTLGSTLSQMRLMAEEILPRLA